MEVEPIKAGPWGGPGGCHWSHKCFSSTVTKVVVAHGWAIDSIMFQTRDKDGKEHWSARFGGGGGGSTTTTIGLSAQEYPTSIRGYYGPFCKFTVLLSLTLVTNLDTNGPYGGDGPYGVKDGTIFDLPISNGTIVGFHGRFGGYLDAIGVYLKPVSGSAVPCETAQCNSSRKEATVAAACRADELFVVVPRAQMALQCPTLWGGVGGRPWDDGVFSDIAAIYLTRDETAICSIKLLYVKANKAMQSSVHGGSGEVSNQSRIKKFDYPHEYLICISGYYGTVEGSGDLDVVRSLTFYTNTGKYGPFVEEIGKFFSTASGNGRIVGRSSKYLDALGAHMEYF